MASTSFHQNATFRFENDLDVALAHPFQERHERSEALIVLRSQSSFIKPLAYSLESFSPRLVNSLKRSLERMVLSSFLSYNFKISTKSWMPPVSLNSLAFLKMPM